MTNKQHLNKLREFKGLSPFSFQESAYIDCMNFLLNKDDSSGIAVLPTAWGKSLLVSWLSLSLFDMGHKVLMVVPSIELLKQNLEKLKSYTTIDVGVYSGSMEQKEFDKPLVIATVNSLKDAHKDFKGFNYIIVDEAHFKFPSKKNADSNDGVFKAFIKKLKPIKILGLTATPFSLGKKNGFNVLNMLINESYPIFKKIIHATQIKQVIDEGRWSKIEYKNYPYIKSGLVLNSTGNEFTEESIELVNKANNVNNTAYLLVKSLDEDSKCLLFIDSLKTSEVMREFLQKKTSRRVEVVTSKTKDKERAEIVETFKTTKDISCIVNVGIFTTGFDCPDLTHIIMARPTNSLSLYYQIIGRGVRVCEGKEFFTYIDLCGNIDRFGKVENITIEDFSHYGWNVFCDDILITTAPLGHKITKHELRNRKYVPFPTSRMKVDFGKHNGTLVTSLPKFYRDFLITSLQTETYLNKEREDLLNLLLKINDYEINKLFV